MSGTINKTPSTNSLNINIGSQYYRAPFPEERFWEADFAAMKNAGLNTVQLWVLWSWVESVSGKFVFDDYDRLLELADKNGLGVVLSLVGEVQPMWIFEEVPDCHLVTNRNTKVVSTARVETHFGLSPGGCFDNPEIKERLEGFFCKTVERYRSISHLKGWDAWNELRWNVHADELVCYCPHTLSKFREWLLKKFGTLDNLNLVWKRRYGKIEEVDPGRIPGRPYTEMMAFSEFMMDRASEHGKWRCSVVSKLDPDHVVTLHGSCPAPLWAGDELDTPLNRGNDWDYADKDNDVGGVGSSNFPVWIGRDDAMFTVRMNFINSAARGKRMWLSELQGGRCGFGNDLSVPVRSELQQYWIWSGLAHGADTILFWCWRDEVFGKETANFGFSGRDGYATERIEAMCKTANILKKYAAVIRNFKEKEPLAAVLFNPQSYFLTYANEGNGKQARDALSGYCRALVMSNIPYRVIEEKHLPGLDKFKIIFLPHAEVLSDETTALLGKFVENGGVLVCESECGAYGENGIYRYSEERFLAKAGIEEIGRRTITKEIYETSFGGHRLRLAVQQWLTPLSEEGELVSCRKFGKGMIIHCASYLGTAYMDQINKNENGTHSGQIRDFETFVSLAAESAGCQKIIVKHAPVEVAENFLHVRAGESGASKLVFVFTDGWRKPAKITFAPDILGKGEVIDIISGKTIEVNEDLCCSLPGAEWGIYVLLQK